jgi:hypothetical protein
MEVWIFLIIYVLMNFFDEYNKIETKNKLKILTLLNKNDGKYRNVYLTNSCNEYMEK